MLKFPHDVQGWFNEDEAAKAQEVCAGKVVLEIGSFFGRSAICIAQVAEFVYSVDKHSEDHFQASYGRRFNTREKMPENLKRYGVFDKVRMFIGAAQDILPSLPENTFDVIHHDAGHKYKDVTEDLAVCKKLLKPGGTWMVHDYGNKSWPDVEVAVKEQLGEPEEVVRWLAVIRDKRA